MYFWQPPYTHSCQDSKKTQLKSSNPNQYLCCCLGFLGSTPFPPRLWPSFKEMSPKACSAPGSFWEEKSTVLQWPASKAFTTQIFQKSLIKKYALNQFLESLYDLESLLEVFWKLWEHARSIASILLGWGSATKHGMSSTHWGSLWAGPCMACLLGTLKLCMPHVMALYVWRG